MPDEAVLTSAAPTGSCIYCSRFPRFRYAASWANNLAPSGSFAFGESNLVVSHPAAKWMGLQSA
jgi:hypothetical protein